MKKLVAVILSAALTLVLWMNHSPAVQLNNSAQLTPKAEQSTQRTRASISLPNRDKMEAVKTETEPKPEKAAATPTPAKAEEPTPQTPSDHEQIMQAAGIDKSDWSSVEYIVQHESSWRPTIRNNEGCIGLGQRCPASTLLSECPDLDATCQLRHFNKYAVSRYGSWGNAAAVWQSQRWW